MPRKTIVGLLVLLAIIAVIVWLTNRNDEQTATPVLSVSAFNQTKNLPATDVEAAPDDIIVYTLNAENQNDRTITGYVMEANISEITDKATLMDASGASYNAGTNSLVWTPLDIPVNESISKQFSVKVNPLPAGTESVIMRIRFNNDLAVTVARPRVAGNITPPGYVAPPTGVSEMLPFLLALLVTSGFVLLKKFRFSKI